LPAYEAPHSPLVTSDSRVRPGTAGSSSSSPTEFDLAHCPKDLKKYTASSYDVATLRKFGLDPEKKLGKPFYVCSDKHCFRVLIE
jgi:hypothetical protein